MIARELINYMVPPLKPEDDIGRAQLWMDELRIPQLPVASEGRFLGIVTEEMLFDDNLQYSEVGMYPLIGQDCHVSEFTHYIEVLKTASAHNTRIVAVLDEVGQYQGVISTEDMVEEFAKSSSVVNPGAILTLKLNSVDYSLSEISRLIEVNEAKILASYVSEYPSDSSKLLLTLKLNILETNRIVASLDNHGFKVEASYNSEVATEDDQERLDIFLKYLKI